MADWLEEHGDQVAQDRARFIRLQLKRARISEHAPEAWASRREEAGLLARYRRFWLGRLDKFVSKAHFERGFADDLVVGVAQFAKNAESLFSLTPVRQLQILRISQTKLTMADLAGIRGMTRLRGLSIRNSNLGDDRVSELLETLSMPHLESLDLTGCNLGSRTAGALRKVAMPRLATLSLANNSYIDRAERVIETLAPFSLQTLNLSFTPLDGESMRVLMEWPGLAPLRRLDLVGVPLGARGVSRLVSSAHLGQLVHLDLSHTGLRPSGAAALAQSQALSQLRTLHVANCELGNGGLERLLSGSDLGSLEQLDLSSNGLDATGMELLAGWKGLNGLRSLRLDYNMVGLQGLRPLLESEHLGPLTSLSLVNTDLRSGVGMLLAHCPQMASLARLDLSYNPVKLIDIEALLASPFLSELVDLKLPAGRIPSEVAARLKERMGL
jgi:Leucine-rich repeat (LRR) protein